MKTMAKIRELSLCLALMSVMTASHALRQRNNVRGTSRIESGYIPDSKAARRLPYTYPYYYSSDCGITRKSKDSKGSKSKCNSQFAPGDDISLPGDTYYPVDSGMTQAPLPVEPATPPSPFTNIPTTSPIGPTDGNVNLPSPNAIPTDLGAQEPTSMPVEPTTSPVDYTGNLPSPTEPTSQPSGEIPGGTEPPVEPTNPPSPSNNGGGTEPPTDPMTPPSPPTMDGENLPSPNASPTSDGSSSQAPNVSPSGDGSSSQAPVASPTTEDGGNLPSPNGSPTSDGSSSPAPDASPTGDGSISQAPNARPTSDGSVSPESSPPPTTLLPHETEETSNGNGLISFCKTGPPSERPAPKVLNANYTYIALVKEGADITQVLKDVEFGTHRALVTDLLSCVFSQGTGRMLMEDVEYTFISSLPQDVPNNEACENIPANQDCYVVDGGITVGYIPPQEEGKILDDVGTVLVDNYDGGQLDDVNDDLIALDFIGFTNESIDDGDDGNGANGIINGDQAADGKRTAGVAAVVSASVVALAVLALLLLVRRRRRDMETSYVSQDFNGKDSLLDEDSIGSGETVTVPHISADSTLSTQFMDQDPKHDVKVCGSSMCPACRAEQGPVFVPSAPINDSIRDISPERLTPDSDRKYAMSDTVDL